MITSEAMIASWTMIRMLFGIQLRTVLTARLAQAVTMVTPMPITSALSRRVVTASAEQMPSTCTPIGLLAMIGAMSAVRSSLPKMAVATVTVSLLRGSVVRKRPQPSFDIQNAVSRETPLLVIVAPDRPSTRSGSLSGGPALPLMTTSCGSQLSL